MLPSILNAIKKILKFTSMCSSISYNIIKYKLRFISFNDAVITTCNSLMHKNYMFTKVIQWGIQDVHDEYNIKDNRELQDYFKNFSNKVPYTTRDVEYSATHLKNAVSLAMNNNDELIIENDHVPMNSGTVALVFKAQLNNIPVVIKILRNNIKNRIKEDIYDLLHFFGNFFIRKIINCYIKIDFKNFLVNNCDILLKQCDFNNEVANALIFSNNLKNKKNIVIPRVYKHFTEALNEIIVMDYLEGQIAKNVPIEKFKNHAITLQTFFFESLFMYNVFHGDFHLGNIIIMNDYTVGIIDFGIVYIVADHVSNDLFNIMFLAVDDDKKMNIDLILKLTIKMICTNKSKHESILKILKNDTEFIRSLSSDFSANQMVNCVNKIMSLKNIEVKSEICNLILSTMSGLNTIEYVNDKHNLDQLLKSYMNRSIKLD